MGEAVATEIKIVHAAAMRLMRKDPSRMGTNADIDLVRAAIPESIALGVEACLVKCNITKN